MNKSDYDKYYKKGGTYVIPVEVFNELFDELDKKDNIINKIVNIYESKDTTEDVYFALEELFKKENITK